MLVAVEAAKDTVVHGKEAGTEGPNEEETVKPRYVLAVSLLCIAAAGCLRSAM